MLHLQAKSSLPGVSAPGSKCVCVGGGRGGGVHPRKGLAMSFLAAIIFLRTKCGDVDQTGDVDVLSECSPLEAKLLRCA